MFHRRTVPSYFGGLPATHDYINNAVVGTPAPVSAQQAGGTYDGTYFEVPQEVATAQNVNRGNDALAENLDVVDDVLHTSRPSPASDDFTAPGGGEVSRIIVDDVFVGKVGTTNNQEERDRLIAVVESSTLEELIDASGTRIVASAIEDGAAANVVGQEADGFRTNPEIVFNITIPAGVNYRLVYLQRGTVTAQSDPTGAGIMGDLVGRVLTNIGRQVADTVGAEAHTSVSSGGINLSTGTVRTQLNRLSDLAVSVSGTQSITGSKTFTNATVFQSALTINTTSPFVVTKAAAVDLLFDMLDVGDIEWNLANNNFFIDLETVGTQVAVRDDSDVSVLQIVRNIGNRISATLGDAVGLVDAYADPAHTLVGAAATTLEGRGVEIRPGRSAGEDGPFLKLKAGAGNNAGAGGTAGHIVFDMNTQEGIAQYRAVVPTESYVLLSGGVGQVFKSVDGGAESYGRLPPDDSSVTIEAHVFAQGWDGGAPNDTYAAYIIRAVGRRDNAGAFSIADITTGPQNSTLDDSGGPTLAVTLVADVVGFHIQVTPPTDASGHRTLWWGYLIVSGFTFTATPDNT